MPRQEVHLVGSLAVCVSECTYVTSSKPMISTVSSELHNFSVLHRLVFMSVSKLCADIED